MASSSGHSGTAVPYRIRLRTLDNKSVLMGGFLPPDSTLQTLANEISTLGHAEAGTFSIAFPVLANHPPATYNPADFGKSLESCGLFLGHLTLALQHIACPPFAAPAPELLMAACSQEAMQARDDDDEEFKLALSMSLQQDPAPHHKKAANWSPPPPLVRGICPRGRIDARIVSLSARNLVQNPPSCISSSYSYLVQENLQYLHEQFPWIPGQESIRPSPSQLQAKHASQREIDTLFESYLDFVLIEIFGFPIVVGGRKRKADCSECSFSCLDSIVFLFSLVYVEFSYAQAITPPSRSPFSSPTNFLTPFLRVPITIYGGQGSPCFKHLKE
jgi:hypothetical protein